MLWVELPRLDRVLDQLPDAAKPARYLALVDGVDQVVDIHVYRTKSLSLPPVCLAHNLGILFSSRGYNTGVLYLAALRDAWIVPGQPDVPTETLPVIEGAGPEVGVKLPDDGAGSLLSAHGCLGGWSDGIDRGCDGRMPVRGCGMVLSHSSIRGSCAVGVEG